MYVFMTKKFFVHYEQFECEKKMIVKEIVSQSKMSPKKKENFNSNEIPNIKAVGFYLCNQMNEW